jgi:hypothetical protein
MTERSSLPSSKPSSEEGPSPDWHKARLGSYSPHGPTTKQQTALVLPSLLDPSKPSEVFYGGAAGGGKSDWLLMAALEYVDVPEYSALIVRRTFSELALPGAIMARSKAWLNGSDARWNEQQKIWTFPSGATVQFAYLERMDHVYRYQGAEFQFIGFDELTQFEELPYRYLFSRLRRPEEGPLAKVPLRMFSASNPGGVGGLWVKKRFVKGDHLEHNRVFVSAKIDDNPHLDRASYRMSLSHLPAGLQAQLMEGDWDAFEGAAYEDFDSRHVVPAFYIPPEWERFEFMDHGTANPAAWYICAVDYDGNLIVFDEYYRGKCLISDHCDAILERRAAWYPEWVGPDQRVQRQHPRTIADPSVTTSLGMLSSKQGIPATITTEYEDQSNNRITLIPGNNDRKAGRARVGELLRCDPERLFPEWHPQRETKGAPRLYIVGHACPNLVEQIKGAPLLPIDSGKTDAGEIVDPDWESAHGHAHAALRYGTMSRPDPSEPVEYPSDDLRSIALIEYEARLDSGDAHRPILIDV